MCVCVHTCVRACDGVYRLLKLLTFINKLDNVYLWLCIRVGVHATERAYALFI